MTNELCLQLRIEKKAGRVFKGWEEGRIYFAPTYKYLVNSDSYAVETARTREKRRTPAWSALSLSLSLVVIMPPLHLWQDPFKQSS